MVITYSYLPRTTWTSERVLLTVRDREDSLSLSLSSTLGRGPIYDTMSNA